MPSPYSPPSPALTIQYPPQPPPPAQANHHTGTPQYMFILVQVGPHHKGTPPSPHLDMFKQVHYLGKTAGNRVIAIQLKCLRVLLVSSCPNV